MLCRKVNVVQEEGQRQMRRKENGGNIYSLVDLASIDRYTTNTPPIALKGASPPSIPNNQHLSFPLRPPLFFLFINFETQESALGILV